MYLMSSWEVKLILKLVVLFIPTVNVPALGQKGIIHVAHGDSDVQKAVFHVFHGICVHFVMGIEGAQHPT